MGGVGALAFPALAHGGSVPGRAQRDGGLEGRRREVQGEGAAAAHRMHIPIDGAGTETETGGVIIFKIRPHGHY